MKGKGAGQRRQFTGSYTAGRVGTVSVAWSVTPDGTSVYEAALSRVTTANDRASVWADPLLVSPATGDFGLKPLSPARLKAAVPGRNIGAWQVYSRSGGGVQR